MRGTSCFPRWAARASRNSRRRACSSSGRAGSARRCALPRGGGDRHARHRRRRRGQPLQPAAADHPPQRQRRPGQGGERARHAPRHQPACACRATPGTADGGECAKKLSAPTTSSPTARTTFATRYLAADICAELQKPLVTAAVGRFDGTVTPPCRRARQGRQADPTYRDLFPAAPPAGPVPTCAEAGILGALTGVLGSMLALEVIREIVGFGEGLVGRLLMMDAPRRCGSRR